MRRSKLEIYVDILLVLVHYGPMKLTHIMYKANVNCSLLEEFLEFLIKQGMVEMKIIIKDRKVFAITQRGVNVLKYFREFKKMLPLDKETRDNARTQREYLL